MSATPSALPNRWVSNQQRRSLGITPGVTFFESWYVSWRSTQRETKFFSLLSYYLLIYSVRTRTRTLFPLGRLAMSGATR